MNETSEFLFQLIKVALGNANRLSCFLNEKEWECLYDAAKKQSLIGLCFMGIQKLPREQLPAMEMVMEWMGQAERIRYRNEQMNRCCIQLQDRLDNDGLRYCILKGQGVASYYGDLSSYRQSGDIDVWILGGFDRVVRYVNSISMTNNVHDHHIDLNIFEDVEVEAHFFPTKLANPITNRRLQSWFVSQEKFQTMNLIPFGNSNLHVPTIEFNLVYQLIHIYRHLFGEGIGLRQLMDYYFTLKNVSINVDTRMKVKKTISILGLETFAGGVMWVLEEVFGMDLSFSLWIPNEKHGKFLLSEIMQMGNFGHQDKRFKLSQNESHFIRYLRMVQSKMRFFSYYPLEVLCQPVGIINRFLSMRVLTKKVKNITMSK